MYASQIATPSVVGMVLQAALAILVPMTATWLFTQVTKLNTRVATWQAWEKRVLVAVYGVVIAGVAHSLGLTLPDALGSLSSVDIQAILSTALAFLLHRVLNPQPATK